jgi:hypothetical protein
MAITNQINKASSLASLRQPQRDKDGQIIRGRYGVLTPHALTMFR